MLWFLHFWYKWLLIPWFYRANYPTWNQENNDNSRALFQSSYVYWVIWKFVVCFGIASCKKKILRSQQEFFQCSTLLLPEKIPLLCIVTCVSCQTLVLLKVQSLHIISLPSSSKAVHSLDHESAPKCFLCCVFPLISLQFSAALPGPCWANTSSMVIYLCMLRNYKQKHKICSLFI